MLNTLDLKRSAPIITCDDRQNSPRRAPGRAAFVVSQSSSSDDDELPPLRHQQHHQHNEDAEDSDDVENVAIIPDEDFDKDEFITSELFWNIIETFNWHNASNGHPNVNDITSKIRKLSPGMKKLFTEQYRQKYQLLNDRMVQDGMFGRAGLNTRQDQAKVVSHAIALGREQFETLYDDFEIFQYLIGANECVSLNAILPMDIAL